jgi:ribonucleoside-diphosphate reductase alpha chain
LIDFIDARKSDRLAASFDKPGRAALPVKRLEIASIELLGPMDVYDIQTESGEFLAGSLRVHNCFILAVDDTMDSILNWYKEEGFIFKGGSGAGLNLSRIRSSKELLSSGGTASGPVSFMRGADARRKLARRRRSASSATPASTWISVGSTSRAFSTRTRTTPCASVTSSCVQ